MLKLKDIGMRHAAFAGDYTVAELKTQLNSLAGLHGYANEQIWMSTMSSCDGSIRPAGSR
jgi:hypothetical protein